VPTPGQQRTAPRPAVAGERYGYRLRWREAGGEASSPEHWVAVPAALALAIEGARPNPATDGLAVAFTLPPRAARGLT
jgi:hypothetical protein